MRGSLRVYLEGSIRWIGICSFGKESRSIFYEDYLKEISCVKLWCSGGFERLEGECDFWIIFSR